MSQARKAWIRANGEIVNGEWKEWVGETTRAILSTFTPLHTAASSTRVMPVSV
jgi:hypothetical protein